MLTSLAQKNLRANQYHFFFPNKYFPYLLFCASDRDIGHLKVVAYLLLSL